MYFRDADTHSPRNYVCLFFFFFTVINMFKQVTHCFTFLLAK